MKLCLIVMLISFVLCSPLRGEEQSNTISNSEETAPIKEKTVFHCHGPTLFPLPGIKWDSTIGPMVSLALFAGADHVYCVVQAEGGLNGAKIELGCAAMQMGGGALKLSGLRTWHDPFFAEPDQTYLGVELEFVCCFVNLNAGLYGHVQGNDSQHDFLMTCGAGIGF